MTDVTLAADAHERIMGSPKGPPDTRSWREIAPVGERLRLGYDLLECPAINHQETR
jgi:hypothetical protein